MQALSERFYDLMDLEPAYQALRAAHGPDLTQAREKLPVTTVILSNRKYQILIGEYFAVGANPGRTAMDMLDLGNPDLDWIRIAQGMGVEAAPTTTLEECADLMSQSFRRPGPFLIELASKVDQLAERCVD